ncbi:MAG: hypothetical protein LBQ54_15095 [Planctomycetaceae bacterium]|jgi:hypothetical protein|nr:hypothetical protein [Planctomycetaceae bacterium]
MGINRNAATPRRAATQGRCIPVGSLSLRSVRRQLENISNRRPKGNVGGLRGSVEKIRGSIEKMRRNTEKLRGINEKRIGNVIGMRGIDGNIRGNVIILE